MSWASHAKTAFGAVTTWDTSVINTIGTVIGKDCCYTLSCFNVHDSKGWIMKSETAFMQ